MIIRIDYIQITSGGLFIRHRYYDYIKSINNLHFKKLYFTVFNVINSSYNVNLACFIHFR